MILFPLAENHTVLVMITLVFSACEDVILIKLVAYVPHIVARLSQNVGR